MISKKNFTSITEAQKNIKLRFVLYMWPQVHAKLIIESLENKLHTFCVKSIASNLNEFKKIIDVKNKHKDLKLVQG